VAYTISSVSAAVGTGISYQWYRDGQAISGATSASYTVTAVLAHGYNVEFKRGVQSTSCVGDVVFSNAIVLTFCGLLLNGVCWAETNVAQPGTFAELPDMHTPFYQWNRLTAYSAFDPLSPAWNAVHDMSPSWTVNPCPEGWRLPTQAEFTALHNSGTTWINSGQRGSAIAGRFYGSNHATSGSCTLPSPMSNCVFFPASGHRNATNGELYVRDVSSNSWSSTQNTAIVGYTFTFDNASSTSASGAAKTYGFTIRCVQ